MAISFTQSLSGSMMNGVSNLRGNLTDSNIFVRGVYKSVTEVAVAGVMITGTFEFAVRKVYDYILTVIHVTYKWCKGIEDEKKSIVAQAQAALPGSEPAPVDNMADHVHASERNVDICAYTLEVAFRALWTNIAKDAAIPNVLRYAQNLAEAREEAAHAEAAYINEIRSELNTIARAEARAEAKAAKDAKTA